MTKFIHGSINLSKAIDLKLVKKVPLRNGEDALFLKIAIFEKKEPKTFTNQDGSTKTFTHSVSCAPKKSEQQQGVNYYIGDLETYDDEGEQAAKPTYTPPTQEEIEAAPAVEWGDPDLPF